MYYFETRELILDGFCDFKQIAADMQDSALLCISLLALAAFYLKTKEFDKYSKIAAYIELKLQRFGFSNKPTMPSEIAAALEKLNKLRASNVLLIVTHYLALKLLSSLYIKCDMPTKTTATALQQIFEQFNLTQKILARFVAERVLKSI